jgi:hypothetical protein
MASTESRYADWSPADRLAEIKRLHEVLLALGAEMALLRAGFSRDEHQTPNRPFRLP